MEIFQEFELNEIDEEWVKSIWDNEFLTFPDTLDMQEYTQRENMETLLKTSCAVVKEIGQDPQTLWQKILSEGTKLTNLLALLGYLMKFGQSSSANENSRQSCIKATTLYFLLVGVPGSNAFNVFHPNLYRKALETLKLSQLLTPAGENELDVPQKQLLIRSLNNLVYELTLMIKSFWFKEHSQSLEDTINVLMEITQMESDEFENRLKRTQASLTSLSHNAYCILQELCDTKHGAPELTVTLIVQSTLPQFLYDNLQPKTHIKIQENCINFLQSLLESHKEETSIAILILIQHLMFKCPDRLEGRQKQASSLIKLISICRESLCLKIMKNLILLTHNQKITHRIFAQEITGQLLTEISSNRDKIQKILIATVLSRCNDISSMVRGRAMSTLSEITAQDSILKDILNVTNLDKEFPTYEELYESVSNETNPIPGLNKILTTLTDRIQDERALVRKSTLRVLKNLTIRSSNNLDSITKLISIRCRDPAMLVRGSAIQILTDLLDRYPNDRNLLNRWIESVIPQIYDIETKVQERVLKSVENLLLVGLRDCKNSLPWKIMKEIMRLKMRKHLSKICYFWVESGIMTNEMIKVIRSYLNTENDIDAWVLLVAISSHRQLNLKDYPIEMSEIFHKNNFHSSLLLELLRNSYDTLTNEQLQFLRDNLYNSLFEFNVALPLISLSLDILYRLSDSQSEIMNLMKTTEEEIEKSFNRNHSNDVRCLRAMTTLGHISYFTNRQIPVKIIRILQGILFEEDELRSTAIVVLAQQSMRDRGLAKEMIPIFGDLLRKKGQNRNEISIQVNSAKALADLCKRFTALVEPYLLDMCLRMKDSDPRVRESIVVIFIQLLLEDYIKLKGPFFFHILTMLTDEDQIIRELTIFLVEERLLRKNKTLIQQRFVESLYHYNNYRDTRDRRIIEGEKILLLPGERNDKKRRVIYDFLLDRLDPPGKLKMIVKLTSRVNNFGITNDLIVELKREETRCTLKDILSILSSNYFQPSWIGKQGHEDDREQEENNTTGNNVVVDGMKKHIVNVLLPTLLRLKLKLKSFKGFGNLLRTMVTRIVKDHKDMVSWDEFPELEKEVEIDNATVEETTEEENNLDLRSPLYKKMKTPRILLRRLSSLTYSPRYQEPGPSTPKSSKLTF